MINLFYDCYKILNKVYSENAFLKQAILTTDVAEKNRSAITKICYGVLDRDIELSFIIDSFTSKSPKLVIRTILKIAIYNIKYLKKAEYAVINSAVELTKKLGKQNVSGFVNAFLRKFIKNDLPLIKDELTALSVKYSYPKFAIGMLIKDYSKETAIDIISYQKTQSFIKFFDVNGEEYLKKLDIEFEKTPLKNLYQAPRFTRNPDYDLGVYTFQSAGSAAICECVEGGKTLLDACAAPGGKSVNLSHKFESVLSLDVHPHRVELIKTYAKRMKRENVFAICQDASCFNEEFCDKFDAVLCDVPCSGFGTINDNPDIKLNKEYSNVIELKNIQLSIIKNCAKYVKVGGYLYYSTCSVFNKENIDNVNEFLSLNNAFILCDVDSALPHVKIDKTLQFLPHLSLGGGYYLAKLKRIK